MVICVFPGTICAWDFLVSIIIIRHDSWFQYRSLHLSFKPICFIVVLPGATPGCEWARNYAVSYQSIEERYWRIGVYTFAKEFGYVILNGSDSPKPCLYTSLPEEKNQVVEHKYLLCTSLLDLKRDYCWQRKTNFLFIPQGNLAAFRCKSPLLPAPHLYSPSLPLSPLIPVWNGFLPNEDNPALAVYLLGYLPGLCTVHNRLCCFYLFLPECT